MPDEAGLERWFRLEMAEVQRSLVLRPIPLQDLLSQARPQAQTRGGEAYVFDPGALHRFAQRLRPLSRALVRLPVLFYLDRDAPGSCFVSDAAQAQALNDLGLLKTEAREGRFWLSEPLAREFARTHPTLAQFVFL